MVSELKDGGIEECILQEVKTDRVINHREAYTTIVRSLLIKFSNGTSISFVIDDVLNFDRVKDFIYEFIYSENNGRLKEMTQVECKKFLEEKLYSIDASWIRNRKEEE